MSMVKKVTLYGNPSACEKARLLLENLPQVRRMDSTPPHIEIRLVLDQPLHERSLIPLLAQSGISGIRLE